MNDDETDNAALGNDCEICGHQTPDFDGVLSQMSPRTARYMLQAAARELRPEKRVYHCLRTPTRQAESIQIMRTAQNSAYFTGLQTCGSVWDCAICAAKISERRARSLNEAVNGWLGAGNYVFLATYTLAHTRKSKLSDVLATLRQAYRSLKSHRSFKAARLEMEYRHDVTALEVTHGANGWHPHLHALIFTEPTFTADTEAFTATASDLWRRSLANNGGSALTNIGFKLQAGNYAANYAAKWGAVREVTNAVSKQARQGGRTPAQLLAAYALNNDLDAARLWREYSDTFHGRSQLQWSPGAKKALGVQDESDTDIAAAHTEEEASAWADIDLITWRFIANGHGSIKPRLLQACEANDRAEFDRLIKLAYNTGK